MISEHIPQRVHRVDDLLAGLDHLPLENTSPEPRWSVYLPAPPTPKGAAQFRSLCAEALRHAEDLVADSGVSQEEICPLLAPLRALADDRLSDSAMIAFFAIIPQDRFDSFQLALCSAPSGLQLSP
jgi:hypothetical protein